MGIATNLQLFAETIATHLDLDVVQVLRLTGADPDTRMLLWPWRVQQREVPPSSLRPPVADGHRTLPKAQTITQALLLAPSAAMLDRVLELLDNTALLERDNGTRVRVYLDDISHDALCTLFQAAGVPMQLALPLVVEDIST